MWSAQWSTLTPDGNNTNLNINQTCISPDPVGFMWGDIRRGDQQTYTQYYNIPNGSKEFRLTVGPNRWIWELPE